MIRLSRTAGAWGHQDFEQLLISDLLEHLAEFSLDRLYPGEPQYYNASVRNIIWLDSDDYYDSLSIVAHLEYDVWYSESGRMGFMHPQAALLEFVLTNTGRVHRIKVQKYDEESHGVYFDGLPPWP